MQIPLQIVFRDIAQSEAISAEIRRDVAKFELMCDRIISCRVTVERAAGHQHQGSPYDVRIDIRVPGEEIVVGHRHLNADAYVAVREACEVAERRLRSFVEQRGGDARGARSSRRSRASEAPQGDTEAAAEAATEAATEAASDAGEEAFEQAPPAAKGT